MAKKNLALGSLADLLPSVDGKPVRQGKPAKGSKGTLRVAGGRVYRLAPPANKPKKGLK